MTTFSALVTELRIEAPYAERDGYNVTASRLTRAADAIEQLERAFSEITWDLANYTFRGKPVSLGEEAQTLRVYYIERAARG